MTIPVKHMFEIIDTTNEEMYFHMGMFETLEEAKKELLEAANQNDPLTDYGNEEDREEISIRVHELGWGSESNIVFTLRREKRYNEKTDDEEWVNINYIS